MVEGFQDHRYAKFIGRVRKPGQYLGGETGEIRKDWDATVARMCLAFPDLYEVGMSHLGYKILYTILNAEPDLLAERAYAPWFDMEEQLRAHGEPLCSLENARALSEFDVVGFSLQFELTYTNVLLMLELGGIPLRAHARTDDDPLVVCGGPVATHAEPLAPFVDAFLIGDGEERTPELLRTWSQARDEGVSRTERLQRLAHLEGLYVPSLYDIARDDDTGFMVVDRSRVPDVPLPVRRAFVPDINAYDFPVDGPVATTETVFDRMSVEVARGCTEGCRFCQAGMIYRPVRERAPTKIVETVRKAVTDGGYDETSLTSLSTADYSAISPLVRDVMRLAKEEKVSVAVSSLRAYGLGEDVLDHLKQGRATGLTFAPEAGTQRMRDVINKNVTEEQLMVTAERVFSRGWQKMKLYFMIGLPTEEDEDVLGIVQTGSRALDVGFGILGKGRAKVVVSVSTHVPKPHTPFQWCAMDDRETVAHKQALLRQAARRTRVQLRMHDSSGSWLEGVLARGDRPLADVIESAYRRGARFDSWQERLRVDAWDAAFQEHEVDPQRYLGTIPVDARLPWDHIDVGLAEGFLAREYRKSLRNRLSPPCGKAVGMFVHHTNVADATADPRKLVCYHCGVACDMSQMREERLVHLRSLKALEPPAPQPAPPALAPQARRRQVADNTGTRPDVRAPRIRLQYARTGRAAFGSHLDMIRLLPRFFRRAGVELHYSRGFHPKPVMTYGPSLPVGTFSLAEYVDVHLTPPGVEDLDRLLIELNRGAARGVEFLAARKLKVGDAPLSKVVDEVEYVAGLPLGFLEDLGCPDIATAQARVADRKQQPLRALREVKGIKRNIDVNRYLIHAAVDEGAAVLEQAGVVGDLVPMSLRLQITPGGTARAIEALGALLDAPSCPVPIVRAQLGQSAPSGLIAPLDLDRLRQPIPSKAAALAS